MRHCSIPYRIVASALAVILASPGWAAVSGPQLPNPGSVSMSREQQEKLGLQAMGEVYKQMPVLPDSSPITRYIQQLGNRLVQEIPHENTWPYQFHVIAQKDINAFALPGGPIFINVGTIAAAQNEAQLAGVMSHEMSHVYMQHSAKQATSTKTHIAEILGAAGGMLGGSVIGDLARAGIQFGAGSMLLKYSREDEAQADAVGAVIMFKAGYNPAELANFFETLSKQGGGPPQFLSDHPNPGNRTAAIEKEVRNWPPKDYRGDTQAFETVKKESISTKTYSAQEIADGAKTGRWARENIANGAVPESAKAGVAASAASAALTSLNFDQVKPNGQFSEIEHAGFSIAYPSNWVTSTGQSSLAIAPKAGASQNAIAYGVIVNAAQDANASSLDQVAQDLIQNLQQSNPGLRPSGDIRRISANGADARTVDMVGDSPLEENGKPLPEHDRLVLRSGPGGSYLYVIFIAPERDFGTLQPTYQRMLDSLRVE
jgi:Zn-dependent protease with chaperone function